jgi:hypothetical protein
VRIAAAVLIVIAAARIASTWWVFNHTMDEPTHIACGLEWLEDRSYTYELLHPPLARIAAAIGPKLLGAPNVEKHELQTKNPLVLYNSPSYENTLASARAGELPFFVVAAVVVFLWTRRLHGNGAALLAVGLFTTLPPVLAHAGLATTDTAVAATTVAALYSLSLWLEQPSPLRSVALGAACAAGILSKFTFLVYFPVAACIVCIVSFRLQRASGRQLVLAAVVCFVLVWAGYWFHLPEIGGMRVPAGEVYLGLAEARTHQLEGYESYLLGERSSSGWWYFFPVVLFYKTPIPFLLLASAGGILAFRDRRAAWAPFLCAVAMLLVVLPSRINLGVRHVLPLYPLLAIAAGYAGWGLFRSHARALQAVCALLLIWQGGSSAAAHPDYLAWFNELAGSKPEEVRVDSDLDWGQNVARLGRYLRERNITEKVGFDWFGNVTPTWHGLNCYPVSPWIPVEGWVAVSATALKMPREQRPIGARGPAWYWLRSREPVDRIGGSILLYNIPRTASRGRSEQPHLPRRVIEDGPAAVLGRDGALVANDRVEVRLGTAALLDGTYERLEAAQAFELFRITDFRGIERAAQHGYRFVVRSEGHGERMAVLAAVSEREAGGIGETRRRAVHDLGDQR